MSIYKKQVSIIDSMIVGEVCQTVYNNPFFPKEESVFVEKITHDSQVSQICKDLGSLCVIAVLNRNNGNAEVEMK